MAAAGYGTGSAFAEPGSGQPMRMCHNRALALQSWFRRSTRWAFWQLDAMIKRKLFFSHQQRKSKASAADQSDRFAATFGSCLPQKLLETTAWRGVGRKAEWEGRGYRARAE